MRTTLILALLLVAPTVMIATAPTAAALYCDASPYPNCSHNGDTIVANCGSYDIAVLEDCKNVN